jgi:hypothetical protein
MLPDYLIPPVSSALANLATHILHPLELIKVRLQSHDGKGELNLVPQYKGGLRGLLDIFRKEGLRGLYRGGLYNYWTNGLASALFFGLY